jgi:uncharacterized protein
MTYTIKKTTSIAASLIAACAIFCGASSPTYAQTADAKRPLAARAVAAQEGPEMDRMLAQLADSATQQMIGNWDERVASLPAAKQQNAVAALDAELKKFNDDTLKLITAQAPKARSEVLVGAYAERFSQDELKQLVALLEAPVFKKYQTTAPELGNLFIKALVDGTRDQVTARSKVFDAAAAKIVGVPATPNK